MLCSQVVTGSLAPSSAVVKLSGKLIRQFKGFMRMSCVWGILSCGLSSDMYFHSTAGGVNDNDVESSSVI